MHDDTQVGRWWVYCFRVGSRYKIGMTSDIETRRRSLRASDEIFLVECFGFDEAIKVESDTLRMFSEWRDHTAKGREWFMLTEDIVNRVMGPGHWNPKRTDGAPYYRNIEQCKVDWDQLERIQWSETPATRGIFGDSDIVPEGLSQGLMVAT